MNETTEEQTLINLPQDVICWIFEFFSPKELLHSMTVCKTFKKAIEATLSKEYYWKIHNTTKDLFQSPKKYYKIFSVGLKDWLEPCVKILGGESGKKMIVYKFLVDGDSKVGKSLFCWRGSREPMPSNYQLPEFDIKMSNRHVPGIDTLLIIWNKVQHQSIFLPSSYYRGVSGIFLLVDLTNINGLNVTAMYMKNIKQIFASQGTDYPQILVVGTKADLKEQIKITEQQIDSFCKKHNCFHILVNNLTGENVELAYKMLFELVCYDYLYAEKKYDAIPSRFYQIFKPPNLNLP